MKKVKRLTAVISIVYLKFIYNKNIDFKPKTQLLWT